MNKNLINHFLIPTTKMNDANFYQSLIYICRHNKDGAWGFVVNEPLPALTVGGLLSELHIDGGAKAMTMDAMKGGVLRPEAGFVLHTGMPTFDSSFMVGENICLTTSRDILPFLRGDSISHFMLLMGFCSWSSNQLEQEIQSGDWLSCQANAGILFYNKPQDKLRLVYEQLGLSNKGIAVGFA